MDGPDVSPGNRREMRDGRGRPGSQDTGAALRVLAAIS